ncbi:MAG: hypothetical protein HXS50_02795 [Theionarchaea archaeon]|nr:hypothetical protein [Theionarchaea archaeon]
MTVIRMNIFLSILVLGTITWIIAPVTGLPSIDGVVSQGEYDSSISFGGGNLLVFWSISGDEFYLAMKGETKGWVSIGIEPSVEMFEADMIFGYVSGDSVTVIDAYSIGFTGPHPPDTEQGGTNDILSSAGSESNGITTIEVKRKLSTGDRYDKDIPKSGNVKIIWGMASSDSSTKKHSMEGSGTLSVNEYLLSLVILPIGIILGRRS